MGPPPGLYPPWVALTGRDDEGRQARASGTPGTAVPRRDAWRLGVASLLAGSVVVTLLGAPALGAGGDRDARRPTAERSSLEARLDRALAGALERTGSPALSAAVVRRGRVIWAGAAGTTRLVGGEQATPGTWFLTASAGKSVTAAMVLRLVDEGRIRLGSRVVRWLPALSGARRITVRQLLRHASGLPDYLHSRRINGIIDRDPDHAWSREEVLSAVGPLRFRPGSRVRYSNTNYVALGGIVEAASGRSVQDAFADLLAGPLGLTESTWRYDESLIGNFARPYLERRGGRPRDAWAGGEIPTDYWGEVWTDGGLATTAAELATIGNRVVAGGLLRPRTRRAMLSFREQGTGLGVFRERVRGRTWVGHDGLYGGFSAQQWTHRGRNLTVAVLANLETRAGRPDASWSAWKRLARAALRR